MAWASSNDGYEVFFDSKGCGPKTLVFVSGFMGISDIWHEQLERLQTQFRCIVMDSRGYGRSDKPTDLGAYSVKQHADDLAAVLNAADVSGPVVLVGHSMGGNIISQFYFSYPERVMGLIYIGTYLSARQLKGLGQTAAGFVDALRKPASRVEFFKSFGLTDVLALESTKWPLHAITGNAQALLDCDVGEHYSEIQAPALVIHGDSDIVNPLDLCGKVIADTIPNAELAVLPHVNHFPGVEAPGPVAALILSRAQEWLA